MPNEWDDYNAGKSGAPPDMTGWSPMYWAGKIEADMKRHGEEQVRLREMEEGSDNTRESALGLLLLPLIPFLLLWDDITKGWNKLRITAVIAGSLSMVILISGLFLGFQFEGASEPLGTWLLRIGLDLIILSLIPRIYLCLAGVMALGLAVNQWITPWLASHITWFALEPYGLAAVIIGMLN